MIKIIKLNNIATFTKETIIDDLKKINFFYGANGSGKTTISKILAKPDNYNTCVIEWNHDRKIKTIVFNEDFIQNYFYSKDTLNGIYTIGEGAKEIEEKIIEKNKEREKAQNELNNFQKQKQEKEGAQKENFDKFEDNCWKDGYQKFQNDFDKFLVE